MATSVLVVTSSSVLLTDHSARRLAEIGVTRITLLGDREGTAVVLEGWAFDPCRSVAEAVAALRVGNAARVLSVIAETSVPASRAGVR